MPHLLIVEDSATQAEQLRFILESSGFNVTVAHRAEAALPILDAGKIDLVISDIMMPGMSGYDLCRYIKAAPSLRRIPVVLLTTRKDPMDIFEGLECGADNFHTKPYDAAHLVERIHYILSNRQLKAEGKLRVGVEVAFFGKIITINSDKEQILDLLISAFEDTVRVNRALESSKEELAAANRKVAEYAQRLEGRIKTSEEHYRTIFNGIAEGIVTLDSTGCITSLNPAAESMFGASADTLLGSPFTRLIAPPHDNFRVLTSSDDARNLDGLRHDGTRIPLSIRFKQLHSDESCSHAIVIRDLTVEKQAEEQLRHSQKMESIGYLTGGLAHDFNNLLTILLGNSEELSERLVAQPELRQLASTCVQAADQGAALTRRLLAFARKQTLNPSLVSVDQLVQGMLPLLQRTLGRGIDISTNHGGSLWKAEVDASQLESALLNLCINARDAMGDSGKLTIETENVALDASYVACNPGLSEGEYVLLTVSDTGNGMPPEVIARAFDPFFTTKGEGKGSGLGLSMVYGFIKQTRGHIKIYSEQGHGASIKLYLPRASKASLTEPPTIPTRQAVHGSELILAVDDDDLIRTHIQLQLHQLGYKVLLAGSGKEALEILDAEPGIDLLLTDMSMPGDMNGSQLAELALAKRPDLGVLFMSGYTRQSLQNNNRLNRDAIMLNKPFRRDQLAEKVRSALEQRP